MSELQKGALIALLIMVGIMACYVCFMIVYFVIANIKDRKKKPKIEELKRQLEHEKANYRSLYEAWEHAEIEHRALALAVNLCKDNNLNLNQLEELGLQRYNALQTRRNFISDMSYEELVKHYIIRPDRRTTRNERTRV